MSKDALIFTSTVPFAPVSMKLCWPTGQSEGNLVFLTFAGALARRHGLRHIVTGVCETDYSGYPDCRDDTMKALQVTLNLGMASDLVIPTPLMWLDKAATWRLARPPMTRAKRREENRVVIIVSSGTTVHRISHD